MCVAPMRGLASAQKVDPPIFNTSQGQLRGKKNKKICVVYLP